MNERSLHKKPENGWDLANKKLEHLPYIEANDLIGFSVVTIQSWKDESFAKSITVPLHGPQNGGLAELGQLNKIPTAAIISAIDASSWSDALSSLPSSYVQAQKEEIATLKAAFFFKRLPILLDINYWGAHICYGPGIAVALAKLMEFEHIPALTLKGQITGVVVHSETDYNTLAERRDQGLWTGTINKDSQGVYASGTVESYVAPWVFAKDTKRAKTFWLNFLNSLGED